MCQLQHLFNCLLIYMSNTDYMLIKLLIWSFIKLQLNKMYTTEEDFLFKKYALLYYQLTTIFPKTFCDRSDSLPFNNMTLHWFLSKALMQIWFTVWFLPLWTVLACKHLFPQGHAHCGVLYFDIFWWLLLEYPLEWLWYSSKLKIFLCKFLVQ